MNLLAYVWIFFAIGSLIYSVLLGNDSDKIIPDSFKRNRNHLFYNTWRMFAGASFLVLAAAFVLYAMSCYQNNASTHYLLVGLGTIMLLIGGTILFIFNRKALKLFNPGFYERFEEEDRQKKALKQRRKEEKEERKRLKKDRKKGKEE